MPQSVIRPWGHMASMAAPLALPAPRRRGAHPPTPRRRPPRLDRRPLVYGLAGTTAVYARSSLERHFRDVQTLRHHGFISESRYQTYGQVVLGVEPEFGLVAF